MVALGRPSLPRPHRTSAWIEARPPDRSASVAALLASKRELSSNLAVEGLLELVVPLSLAGRGEGGQRRAAADARAGARFGCRCEGRDTTCES
jgi:hypothetical protein